MRSSTLAAAGFLLAGCSNILGIKDPTLGDADGGDVAKVPCDVGASQCCIDHFDGSALDPHWRVLVGAAPVSDVSVSRLLISDAPLADTPSSIGTSWIYDLSSDKGNQLAWPQAIGGSDFTVTAEIAWSSTFAEVTLGGIGIAEQDGTLRALVGVLDDSKTEYGGAFVRIADNTPARPLQSVTGSKRFKIQRIGGMGSMWIDEKMTDIGPLPAPISDIVIYYVRHADSNGVYDFGEVEIRELEICRP